MKVKINDDNIKFKIRHIKSGRVFISKTKYAIDELISGYIDGYEEIISNEVSGGCISKCGNCPICITGGSRKDYDVVGWVLE